MKTVGIGIDIVELWRIRQIRFLERFAELTFSPGECNQLQSSKDAIAFVASRFAVKEAVIKAFPHPLTSKDFEIRKEGIKPVVHFFNSEHRRYIAHVSLSHSTDYAAGYARVEYEKDA
jgi:phosphopantetheine--protein transferase-like protein